jgi:GNAT superfamily N-acetyltransferase
MNRYGIKPQSLYYRKKYFKENGRQWYEDYFDIIEVEYQEKPIKKCPYCDWFTYDIENKSGAFISHLQTVHGINRQTYIEDHPEDFEYLSLVNETLQRQFETDERKFITCGVCGKKLTKIDERHLKLHGITREEYIAKYGDKLICDDLRDRLSMSNKESNKDSRTEEFIRKAKIVHTGEKLDYSKVVYINNRTPVCIIDHELDENGVEYGEFWQTPSNHLKGQKHPRKRGKIISKNKRMSQEEFIKRAKEAHKGENLDYSQVVYKGAHEKVYIIDHTLRPDGTEYGGFWQEANAHLKGCSHPDKAINKHADSCRSNKEEFVSKVKKIFPNQGYNYDDVEYVNNQTKVKVICPKHGVFEAIPFNLLAGKGCPVCAHSISKPEIEICELVKSIVGDENVIVRDRTVLCGKELDIYIPSKNIAIEYDGLLWHSEKYNKDRLYHFNKTEKCKELGIRLIHIFEDEYKEHKDIVLNKIRHMLGADSNEVVIGARKCTVSEVNRNVAREFLDKYHIQGFGSSTEYYGAYYNNEIVAVMSFLEEKKGEWNLTRFATNTDYRIPGIASKLFKHFITIHNDIKFIKSFLDRRWNIEGNTVYEKLGFRLDGINSPDYYYTDGVGRFHKFGFRKEKLHRKYGLPLIMTEYEMTQELGFYRIWNCGLAKYVWKQAV